MKYLSAISLTFALLTASVTVAASAQTTPGYDVIMLAGQSNMVGYNTTADNASDAAVSSRVFMWNGSSAVVPATDPLYMTGGSNNVGPGLTFAKAYAASLASNRNVLLVGVAKGATGFNNGWLAPNGNSSTDSHLATSAVTTVNAAIAAAGSGARFAGIVWDQGENDIVAATYPSYQTNLINLIKYFRSNITGANGTTPFVATEMTYPWMIDNINGTSKDQNGNSNVPGQYAVQTVIHQLPDLVSNAAWTASAGLASDSSTGDVHFNTLSQRQMGRRDADRFFEAQIALPQAETQMVASNGGFLDIGRSYPNNTFPVNFAPSVNGTVGQVVDTARGTVAQISKGQGFLSYSVPASTFNGSYTKMAWFQAGNSGYYNNLVSANNSGQAHYMLAQYNGGNKLLIIAGHSDGSSAPLIVYQTVQYTPGTWINVAVSYDASAKTMSLYYNGALASFCPNVAPAPALTTNSTVPLTMGSFGSSSSGASVSGTDGQMGGNRVWTSALTQAQIQAVYQHELSYRAGW